MLEYLRKGKIFTKIDLRQAFILIKIKKAMNTKPPSLVFMDTSNI